MSGLPGIGAPELLIVGIIGLITLAPVVVAIWLLVRFTRDSRNPNLTTCPDCSQRISPRAQACPHCGAPQRATHASL
jgi:hypothetical protein